jgi:hypothetical protein
MTEFEQIKNSINTVFKGIDIDRQLEILDRYLGMLILERNEWDETVEKNNT